VVTGGEVTGGGAEDVVTGGEVTGGGAEDVRVRRADGGEVRWTVDGSGVATVTLRRRTHNQLTPAFLDALCAALRSVDADPAVRAVVLTGDGRAFCAGADLSEGRDSLRGLFESDGGYADLREQLPPAGHRPPADRPGDPAPADGYREPAARTNRVIAAMGVPVIAAVNGDAVGGGATITLAADVRFAAPGARFGFPFTRLGLCPEGASTWYLPRVVGPSVAAQWLLSGRLIPAEQALRAGLVSELVEPERLLAHARRFAAELVAGTSPAAVAATRALLHADPAHPDAAAAAESRTIVTLARGEDCAEAAGAFLARRPPRFGRRAPGGS
jgi:enoyl-CoA hydratase/carnithine racemase